MKFFSRTKSSERADEVARASWKKYEEIHEEMWPTVKAPALKRRRRGKKNDSDEQNDTIKFAMNTMTTSMVVSCLIQKLQQSRKLDHAYTIGRLQALLEHNAATLNNFVLSFQRLGSNTCDLVSFTIDVQADVAVDCFFTPNFWTRRVADAWAEAYRDPKQPWISVENPLMPGQRVKLASLIGFALSPGVPPQLASKLRGPFLALMGRYAHVLNDVAKVMPEPAEFVPVFAAHNFFDASMKLLANTALKLWSGGETWRANVLSSLN